MFGKWAKRGLAIRPRGAPAGQRVAHERAKRVPERAKMGPGKAERGPATGQRWATHRVKREGWLRERRRTPQMG